MASLGNLFFKIGADVSEATKGIKEVKGQLESIKKITGFTAIIQGANAAIGVFNSLVSAVRPLVEEFDKAAKGAAKLETALKGDVAGARQLIDQANQLAGTRLFPSDVTVNAQAMLATLGFTKNAIKQLIPVVQDFASATGTELTQAAQAVGKSIAFGGEGLKKYGVQVSQAVNPTERFTETIKQLTNAYGGQSEAAAKVGAGPLQLLVQRFSQIKEIAGESLISFVNELLPAANAGVSEMVQLLQALPQYAANVGRAIVTVLTPFKEVYQQIIQIDSAIGAPLQKVQKLIQSLFGFEQQSSNAGRRIGGTLWSELNNDLVGIFKTLDANAGKKLDIVTNEELAQIDLARIKAEEAAAAIDRTLQKANLPLTTFEQNLFKQEKVLQPEQLPSLPSKLLPNEGIQKQIDALKTSNDAFNESLKTTGDELGAIGSAAVNAFAGLASGLLDGSIAFKDLGRAALAAAGQIIKAALAEALAAGIAKSIKNNPNILIGIAIAGVAVAAILSLFRSKVPKLAKGGLAYGPQLAIVGDNPNASRDPEVISPLSKLKDMLTAEMYKMTGMMATAMDAALSRASVDVPTINQDAIQSAGPQEIIIKGQIDGSVIRLAYDRSASTQSKFQPNYY